MPASSRESLDNLVRPSPKMTMCSAHTPQDKLTHQPDGVGDLVSAKDASQKSAQNGPRSTTMPKKPVIDMSDKMTKPVSAASSGLAAEKDRALEENLGPRSSQVL